MIVVVRRAGLLVCALLVAAGCRPSEPDPADPDLVASTRELPPCVDVWVPGTQLLDDYQGCLDGRGHPVTDGTVRCEDGGVFTTYDHGTHPMYGRYGGTIAETATSVPREDADYVDAYTTCVGREPPTT